MRFEVGEKHVAKKSVHLDLTKQNIFTGVM